MKQQSDPSSRQKPPRPAPPIIDCQRCKTGQPMAIKSVHTFALTGRARIEYFCVKCGHRTTVSVG